VPTPAPYSISDLARLTGISVRTIRYYLAQGLIPASGESGPGAHYGAGHLGRLQLVRRLQQQHLPLAEIRARLAALTDDDVAALVSEPPAGATEPVTSALDYVRSVLADPSPVAASPVVALPSRMPAMRDGLPAASRELRRMATPFATTPFATTPFATEVRHLSDELASGAEAAGVPAPPAPTPQSIERSQWERLSLGPNLELHIRRPLGRLEQKRVERLITIARQVLKEEQP
jgi:DNA-binding transcriptional MerR regulator